MFRIKNSLVGFGLFVALFVIAPAAGAAQNATSEPGQRVESRPVVTASSTAS